MTVSLANSWTHIGILMLCSAYPLFLISKGGFRRCRHEIHKRGFTAALPFCFWQFRWHPIFIVFAFGASLALVVGTHRLFDRIETGDAGLTLDYPWPRSDVHLNWEDVTASKVEVHRFRRRTMFRLSVKAGSSVYVSPWTGQDETQRAYDAIQAHLGKPQKSLPKN